MNPYGESMTSPEDRLPSPGSIPIAPYPSVSAEPAVRSVSLTHDSATSARLMNEVKRLDAVLVGSVLVLAFLLGSFIATNSDVWMHLATGRLIANGQYQFGDDPFSYSTPGVRWVNHSWLPDWLGYVTSVAVGGPEDPTGGGVLVVLKALVITATTGIMLLVCRREGGTWLATVGVTLALLAMMPRMLLQPRCASFLFLAITLYLLTRRVGSGKNWQRLAGIPVLFVLWVNFDDWFLLGPVVVAMFFVAACIERLLTPQNADTSELQNELKTLLLILVVGVAACLLNPYHLYAFQLPPELHALLYADRNDPQIQSYISSPFRWEYVYRPTHGIVPAGVAYVVLLGLGLSSFYFVRERWPWWRLIVWVGFAALSLGLERTVPFFAVAGTIVTILNFQDSIASRSVQSPRIAIRGLIGRLVSIVALVALILLAWPGWLTPETINPALGNRSRRVTWAIHDDPSHRGAAIGVRELRAKNVIEETQNGFSYSRDFVNYCAWFCPEEKGFVDFRFSHFLGVLRVYADVRDNLHDRPTGLGQPTPEWVTEFKQRNINHIIIGGTGGDLLAQAKPFWAYPEFWPLLYADGRTCIFGWNGLPDGPKKTTFDKHRLNFDRIAYGRHLPPEEQAPESPPPPPQTTPWWTTYFEGELPRPLAVDASNMYSNYFEVLSQRMSFDSEQSFRRLLYLRNIARWIDPLTVAPAGGGLLQTLYTLRCAISSPGDNQLRALIGTSSSAPSGALMLAVRAGRRGNFQNPNSAVGYAALGTAYLTLWRQQEGGWLNGGRGTLLHQLRLVQIVTAMQNALALRPDDHGIHQALAETYQQLNVGMLLSSFPHATMGEPFIDLELYHWKEFLERAERLGPSSLRLSDEDFPQWVEGFKRRISEQEKAYDFQRRCDQWEVSALNKPRLERAIRAVQFGLVKKALDELESATSGPRDEMENQWYMRLMLLTGRASFIDANDRQFADPWNTVLFAATTGNYHGADVYLDEWTHALDEAHVRDLLGLVRRQYFPGAVAPLPQNTFLTVDTAVANLQTRIDLEVVRGVLALEAGNTSEAESLFRRALEMSTSAAFRARRLLPFGSGALLDSLTLTASAQMATGISAVPFSLRPVANNYLLLLREAK